jgi:hypothetical protein
MPEGTLSVVFSRAAHWAARQSGRAYTFIVACLVIIGWAATGPLFNYSDTWQLIINTGTTIITFLMVFLLQNTQTRDTAAIQLKLGRVDKLIEGDSPDAMQCDSKLIFRWEIGGDPWLAQRRGMEILPAVRGQAWLFGRPTAA